MKPKRRKKPAPRGVRRMLELTVSNLADFNPGEYRRQITAIMENRHYDRTLREHCRHVLIVLLTRNINDYLPD